MSAFTVGPVSVEKGQKLCGRIPVCKRADGSEIYIPVMIVHGAKDGPVVNVSSGVHGDEYEGAEAIRRWYRRIDPKTFAGVYLGTPVVNIMAFEAGVRAAPYDHTNLNRVFPGKERGFFSERLAWVHFNEVVKRSHYVADCHNGGNIMALAPMAIYRDIGGEDVARRAEKLVMATGIELIWKGSGGWTGPVSLEAQRVGIPAITIELAGEGRMREDVVAHFEKIIGNVLTSFDMAPGKPDLPAKVTHFEGTFINSINGGLYHQRVAILSRVKAGDLCGVITDFFGDVVEEIRAPFDGVVASGRTFGTIEPGGWTLMVGKIL